MALATSTILSSGCIVIGIGGGGGRKPERAECLTIDEQVGKGTCTGNINGVEQTVVDSCRSKEDCTNQALDEIAQQWKR